MGSNSHPRFELKVSLPYDSRFVETLRLLAVHAARYAGSSEPNAEAFGRSVEEAAQDALRKYPEGEPRDSDLDVVVRRDEGPVEVVIGRRTLTINP
jgi:hypothetical protein